MNTTFLFDNMIIFPLCAVVVIATYLIQFCSVISPCRIEFDEDSRREMRLMERYNVLSDNAFTMYISVVLSGMVTGILMSSVVVLIIVMVAQAAYLVVTMAVMLAMYDRSKQYWSHFENKIPSRETLTISGVKIYN